MEIQIGHLRSDLQGAWNINRKYILGDGQSVWRYNHGVITGNARINDNLKGI